MSKLTLLIVDDIEMNRDIVCKIFGDEYVILQAANGVEAMKLIESTPVEIVITDIFMEPMNGYELIKAIRAKEEYKKIPIIAVTESDHASRKMALKAGADDLVYKPFIQSILQNRVKGLLYDGYDLNRYKLAYENNPVPFVVYHVIYRPDTPNYKIMYMNRAARESYSPPFIEDMLQTDEKPDIRDFLMKAVNTAEPQRTAIFEPELNRWLDWTIYPDGSGLVASMIHDITGEIEKQTFLAQSSAKLAIDEKNRIHNIVENSPSGIFVFKIMKDDLAVVDANASGCKLLDVDPTKIVGANRKLVMSFVHPEDHRVVYAAMERLLTPEQTTSWKCRIINRTKNQYVWFSAKGHSKKEANGEIFAYINYSDISLEKELEETKLELLVAQKSNMAKTDFLSRVSHDMRTPLNAILGLTGMLKEKINDEDALRDIEQLQMSEQYLLNLIKDTLDVSRIEKGKLELHPTVCEGRAIFNTVINLAKVNIGTKHLHFAVKADNLPFSHLYLDVGRVEQVAMNLIGNAIKFTPEGGTITFSIENISVTNDTIVDRITIEDTGVGMSKEFLPHLFEPFTQENNGVTSTTDGTGLGMTITQEIVKLLGGTISVESELYKGTKFTIDLPLKIATDKQIKEWQENEAVVYDENALIEKRILLCEDHPLNAAIATRLLEKKGMLVEQAENGEIGVEMFKNSKEGYYDAILMDIRMPVMDGITATRTIRGLSRNDAHTIPIIAMTANVMDHDMRQTKAAGMNEHLEKPIDKEKLYEALEKSLSLNRYMKKMKILVVDDAEINRQVLMATLEDEYTLLQANNGEEALSILEKTKGIDAVITDIQMPVMNGIDLIKKIRENPRYSRIAILASTQYGDPTQEEELLAIGADDFIYKPMTPTIVKSRVHRVLK